MISSQTAIIRFDAHVTFVAGGIEAPLSSDFGGSPFQIRANRAISYLLESHIDGFRRCGTNPSFPAP
jgi:hypothetical protein